MTGPRATGRSEAGESRRLTRRRVVVIVALVVGTVSGALTLRLEPGDDRFLAGASWMALVWALGAWLSGPLPTGDRHHRAAAVGRGVLVGAVAIAVCVLGGLVVARIPLLRDPAQELLAHAGPDTVLVVTVALVNGVVEELFFRGALYDAVPARWAVPVTTVVYAATTLGSGVALLAVAAVVLGALTAVLRRWTGGVLAPIAAHVTWSVAMLLVLPPVLATGG